MTNSKRADRLDYSELFTEVEKCIERIRIGIPIVLSVEQYHEDPSKPPMRTGGVVCIGDISSDLTNARFVQYEQNDNSPPRGIDVGMSGVLRVVPFFEEYSIILEIPGDRRYVEITCTSSDDFEAWHKTLDVLCSCDDESVEEEKEQDPAVPILLSRIESLQEVISSQSRLITLLREERSRTRLTEVTNHRLLGIIKRREKTLRSVMEICNSLVAQEGDWISSLVDSQFENTRILEEQGVAPSLRNNSFSKEGVRDESDSSSRLRGEEKENSELRVALERMSETELDDLLEKLDGKSNTLTRNVHGRSRTRGWNKRTGESIDEVTRRIQRTGKTVPVPSLRDKMASGLRYEDNSDEAEYSDSGSPESDDIEDVSELEEEEGITTKKLSDDISMKTKDGGTRWESSVKSDIMRDEKERQDDNFLEGVGSFDTIKEEDPRVVEPTAKKVEVESSRVTDAAVRV